MKHVALLLTAVVFAVLSALAHAAGRYELANIKVVTDASPDYADIASMVHFITSRWDTPKEKCWALFYWNHIAHRQTGPMHLRFPIIDCISVRLCASAVPTVPL